MRLTRTQYRYGCESGRQKAVLPAQGKRSQAAGDWTAGDRDWHGFATANSSACYGDFRSSPSMQPITATQTYDRRTEGFNHHWGSTPRIVSGDAREGETPAASIRPANITQSGGHLDQRMNCKPRRDVDGLRVPSFARVLPDNAHPVPEYSRPRLRLWPDRPMSAGVQPHRYFLPGGGAS